MRRYLVAAGILALMVWTSVGWRGPALTVHGAAQVEALGYGGTVPSEDEMRTFGVVGLCLAGGRSATVSAVDLVDAHGLAAVDFGTARLGPSGPEVPGVMLETPRQLGYTREPLTQQCDEPGVVALAYSVRVTDPALASRAWARGIKVHYRLDGVPGTLTVAGRLTLCLLPTERISECRHPDEIDSDA